MLLKESPNPFDEVLGYNNTANSGLNFYKIMCIALGGGAYWRVDYDVSLIFWQ